jgi:protein-disulfide isomerase
MRQNVSSIVFVTAIGLAAAACHQDNAALERKLDQLKLQVSALDQKLTGLAGGGARPQRPHRPEPDPKAVYAVPVEGNPIAGAADAPVTIVEGYEYACPACKGARETVAQLRARYGDKVRVVYKQYLVHPDVATNASLASCAAHRQDKFSAMDRILWDKGYEGGRDFSQAKIEAFAAEAGLDLERFKADVAGPCRDAVARDHGELQALGQGATPTFYINGRYVLGASPVALGAVIDEELALAEKRIGEGTSRGDYYRTWVLDKGLKRFDPPRS